MSKERLGFDLEREMKHLKKIVDKDDRLTVSSRFMKYFIEQAERVQELERQNKALELEVDGWFNKANEIHESMLRQDKVIDKFRQQNKRYKEVINNNNEKAMLYGVDEQVYEAIKEAIKALEGEE